MAKWILFVIEVVQIDILSKNPWEFVANQVFFHLVFWLNKRMVFDFESCSFPVSLWWKSIGIDASLSTSDGIARVPATKKLL